MATVDVSVSSDLTPEQAWELASNLHRFDEWLTIFGGWKSQVPDVIEKGTKVSSLIKVKGFRNVIGWEVQRYDPPTRIEMRGSGRGGVRIALGMTITDDRPTSTFHLLAELSGALLNGPVGSIVARVLRSDVERSVCNLAALGATAPGATRGS
ncbi:SRPBCC family protein [Mycolicibacterium sp. P9-64]|uniref:type II toxin-antitoxin system Rv0910 family toxin n=1 Tax=Mycolicibacterium sp. P9-64 TaxID=2024612 RepID=UPI0011EF90C8|nr:SRPBCC family protein [Mycolicibacterium sp. P9-64]KAA0085353.1 SRPBCC family protein [Mycolicibacterium sp. P9-64]